MEPITALTIIVSLQIIFNVILAISNDNLKSKINKQQEQIRILGESTIELGIQDIKLVQLANHMTQVSKDIATKVMSIEERVDKHNRLIEYCADGIVNLEKRINIIDKIV